MRPRVIIRIVGGLGNQLFCYAFARALALRSDAELVLDASSGFERDYYRRHYMLRHFGVAGREATRLETLPGTAGRAARVALRLASARLPLALRPYLREQASGEDPRLASLRVHGICFVEGYFQREAYFQDAAAQIREDLREITPLSDATRRVADAMARTTAVALHVRRLRAFPAGVVGPDQAQAEALGLDYYARAVAHIAARVERPHFYVFSDHPDWARGHLDLQHEATFVDHNEGDDRSHEDLYLMARCRHHVIANSTFSWWGAWLAEQPGQVVVAPPLSPYGMSDDLIPTRWTLLR